ncbi:MAG: DUF3298 and DUF4163 domain-containing protein [Candidatus Buchananbacteria bacterium]
MKKNITIIVILFIVLCLIVFAAYQLFSAKTLTKSQNNIQTTLVASEKNLGETGKYFEIKALYPLFDDQAIDQAIETFIQNQVAEFKKNAELNKNYPPVAESDAKFAFNVAYNYFLSDKILSIKLEVYQYTGGAHGNTLVKTFNFSLADKKDLGLKDIFASDHDYLKIISDDLIASLKQTLTKDGFNDDDWLNQGAGPKAENLSTFVFTPSGLTFIFQPYQDAPYAAGILESTLPYSKINELVLSPYQNLTFN